jgi:cytochrome P450
MTEAEIKANILTFIAAGNETAANALTWAVMLLSMSPEWLDIVRAEAETAWSGPQETLTDRLPMTRAVIEETLRLYPSIVAISREAVAEDEICGSRIKPGSMVVVCPYVLHRHRALWSDPDVFDPSRFAQGRTRHDRFSWIPFGVGPRICIGSAFALQEITILLSMIVQNFDLTLPKGHEVKPVLRVTLKPSCGLPMLVRAR